MYLTRNQKRIQNSLKVKEPKPKEEELKAKEEELKEDRDLCGRADKMGQEVKGADEADKLSASGVRELQTGVGGEDPVVAEVNNFMEVPTRSRT